ncbi:hypothetical protein SO802_002595 [Lithocarpus litseifolius]|uniref:Uncharacterized protein n=1 Tax=Lithocarpus litseifolius TaxID=425828 RepID=A0AAW2E317_9ROSI
MNKGLTMELKELESKYEKVVDENCRLLVRYFKEVLENKDGNKLISAPPITLTNNGKVDTLLEYSEDEKIKREEELVLQNGRYNPIWAGGERSVEFSSNSGTSKSKPPPFCPQRVSPDILTNQKSIRRLKVSPSPSLDSEPDSSLDDNSAYYSSSSESEDKVQEKNKRMACLSVDKAASKSKSKSNPFLQNPVELQIV